MNTYKGQINQSWEEVDLTQFKKENPKYADKPLLNVARQQRLGEASIKVELKNKTITIYHGTDKTILRQFPAQRGSWEEIWKGIDNANKVEEEKAEYRPVNDWTKVEYINRIIDDLERIRIAFQRLSDHWGHDSSHEIDLNDSLATMYPFACSFDELQSEVNLWAKDGTERLIKAKKMLEQPKIVEEDQPPYVAVSPQFGRPFTIRHCVNCGQRLMVDPLDFLLNVDKDVICDACKNPKKYEKTDQKAIRM